MAKTPPLFLLPPDDDGPGDRKDENKKRVLRSVRMGKCPYCTVRLMGVIPQGEHYVWRPHSIITWGGARIACRASGVAVCLAPERIPLVPGSPIKCPHDRRR